MVGEIYLKRMVILECFVCLKKLMLPTFLFELSWRV
jgi:hypothetical protein